MKPWKVSFVFQGINFLSGFQKFILFSGCLSPVGL